MPMSTSSGRTGFCRVCRHTNENHKYDPCKARGCRYQIKSCRSGGHKSDGWAPGVKDDDIVICKECPRHGRNTNNEHTNSLAVIGIVNRRKVVVRERIPDSDDSSGYYDSSSYSTPNRQAAGGTPGRGGATPSRPLPSGTGGSGRPSPAPVGRSAPAPSRPLAPGTGGSGRPSLAPVRRPAASTGGRLAPAPTGGRRPGQ
ncbi:hypothetical protein QBC40DRAFT_284371 [Triangularia verruculosa]|uniref:Uncharacterized protein n=1 Tax=Triangularia verruculosa TaxID=2587418 RepID=A0AAN6XCJ2_9PEZI|nr:hypothetical protein QBC40DRAFT_284371 [Triangularia verruculosa]